MAKQQENPGALGNLIEALKQLPGIGEKTATRLAYFVLRQPVTVAQSIAESLIAAREQLHTCHDCCNFTETEVCPICSDPSRQESIVCVVEQPSDLAAFEKSRHYQGKYHVLHGILSPLDGVDESKLKVKELIERVKSGKVQEVVLATNPTVEGDTTALYIARLIKYNGIKVSRIAHGIPVGSEIEYLDGATLSKALQNRVTL
ncbi:MAG: recombination protein RecR [Deltaproteobacteria bacterium]|nr:recombination protein RecR [Deltaproteobacteria bacterium]MBI3295417.1 recombination protein RecR [Deltaproteobacteria bacterium]